MTTSDKIFERGLAIGSYDILDGSYIFRFRDERYTLRRMMLDNGRPNRCVRTFTIPELRYGVVARIEEIRQAMEFEL